MPAGFNSGELAELYAVLTVLSEGSLSVLRAVSLSDPKGVFERVSVRTLEHEGVRFDRVGENAWRRSRHGVDDLLVSVRDLSVQSSGLGWALSRTQDKTALSGLLPPDFEAKMESWFGAVRPKSSSRRRVDFRVCLENRFQEGVWMDTSQKSFLGSPPTVWNGSAGKRLEFEVHPVLLEGTVPLQPLTKAEFVSWVSTQSRASSRPVLSWPDPVFSEHVFNKGVSESLALCLAHDVLLQDSRARVSKPWTEALTVLSHHREQVASVLLRGLNVSPQDDDLTVEESVSGAVFGLTLSLSPRALPRLLHVPFPVMVSLLASHMQIDVLSPRLGSSRGSPKFVCGVNETRTGVVIQAQYRMRDPSASLRGFLERSSESRSQRL